MQPPVTRMTASTQCVAETQRQLSVRFTVSAAKAASLRVVYLTTTVFDSQLTIRIGTNEPPYINRKRFSGFGCRERSSCDPNSPSGATPGPSSSACHGSSSSATPCPSSRACPGPSPTAGSGCTPGPTSGACPGSSSRGSPGPSSGADSGPSSCACPGSGPGPSSRSRSCPSLSSHGHGQHFQ